MTIDIEKLAKENGFITHVADDGECYADIETLKQFAEAYAAKVLEDKEREINKTILKSLEQTLISECEMHEILTQENIELKSHINDLREALEEIRKCGLQNSRNYKLAAKLMNSAYTKTPAQNLQEHDNEVIEKCANVCETVTVGFGYLFAKSIRELKGNHDGT